MSAATQLQPTNTSSQVNLSTFGLFPGEDKGQNYPFGIMGMTNKADCLQKGEHVKFQVCTVTQTGQKMACNVVPQRRAPVECVKDQVEFT